MLSPTDAAWSVLEEGHRVEKVFLPAALGALAVVQGLRNAGVRVRNPLTEDGVQNPFTLDDTATIEDPFGGVIASKEIEDPNALQRVGAGLAQVAPVGGVISLANRGSKALRAIRPRPLQRIREADRAQAAARLANAERDAAEAAGHVRRLQASQRNPYSRRLNSQRATNDEIDQAYRIAEDAEQLAIARRARAAQSQRARGGGGGGAGRTAAGGVAVSAPLAYAAYKLGDKALDTVGNAFSVPHQQPSQQAFTQTPQQQGGFQLAGQPSGGIGGVGNVNPGQTQRYDIFQGVNWNQPQSAQPIQQNWKQQNTPTSTVQTGMAMSLGDRLLKTAQQLLDNQLTKGMCAGCTKPECVSKNACAYGMAQKADKCKECGKAECVGKAGCGMAKAEDKKKKPAHGMVIVIGSKAGPGPSTNGKRDDDKKE